MKRFTIFILLLLISRIQCVNYPIEHIVVLLEENRSFDQFFGYYNNPNVNVLKGNESNPTDIHDKNSLLVYVDDQADYVTAFDPDHSMGGTATGIFGDDNVNWDKTPNMNGFIYANIKVQKQYRRNIMSMFQSSKIPIITSLANEFALIDAFFASVPGPTCPNRYYAESATSAGMIDNIDIDLKQDTIYDRVKEAGKTWRIYFSDVVFCSMNFANLKTVEARKNLHYIDQFYADAKSGNLPHYTFLHPYGAPSAEEPANDQHPDHTVAAGELFVKNVYEALRSSPLWNKTLFIYTYDEHGGFYDHVPPPMNVPSPDNKYGANGFKFNMLGVRIPAILISPWINKGVVEHEPNGPYPNSQYDLSSIPATVKKIFGWKNFLTKRDSWSGTFDHLLLQRTTPRTDCPMHLPPAPSIDPSYLETEKQKPLNDLQITNLKSLERALGLTTSSVEMLKTQEEYSHHVNNLMKRFLKN